MQVSSHVSHGWAFQDVCLMAAVTIAALTSIYYYLLPKPINGIPCNSAAVTSLLGDIPAMEKECENNAIAWMIKQAQKFSSPICQLFIIPFGKPVVFLSDFHESQDILMRRKEFDRSDYSIELLGGSLKMHHINLKTGPTWKAHRRLLQDLMTPKFLNNVAGRNIYDSVSRLVTLWDIKARAATGCAFAADKDIYYTALDAVLDFTFGSSYPDRALPAQIEAAERFGCEVTHRNHSTALVTFTLAPVAHVIVAILQASEAIGEVSNAGFISLAWWWRKLQQKEKKFRTIRRDFLQEQASKATAKLESNMNSHDEEWVNSAADLMIQRERTFAEKDGREPVYWSDTIHDEACIDLQTCCYLKFMADNEASQNVLRRSLQSAHSAAFNEKRAPTYQEILKTSIPYLDAVIEEILRLAHTIPLIERQCTQDTVILGHPVPKGTTVFMPSYGPSLTEPGFQIDDTLRHESSQNALADKGKRTWPEAGMNEFLPERWLSGGDAENMSFDGTNGPILAFGLDSAKTSMILEEASNIRWPAILAAAVILSATLLLRLLNSFNSDPLAKIPYVGSETTDFANGGGWKVYAEGYKKFKNSIFRLSNPRPSPTIVVASSFLPELQRQPSDVLSFGAAMDEALQGEYTGMDHEDPVLPYIVKTSLTPALLSLNQLISKNVKDAMRLELPQTKNWTEINIHNKLLRIVAMASGHIFVGSDMCRNEQYLYAIINYTLDVTTGAYTIGYIPKLLRPWIGKWLPQITKIDRHRKELKEILQPTISARKKASEDPDYQKPEDLLQWLIDAPEQVVGKLSNLRIARYQLEAARVSVHTTTLTALNMFYTIAADPNLASVLREDVQQALSKTGGQYSQIALQEMKKLDSCLKEVMRYHPMGPAIFRRKALKSFTLSTGQFIPAGTVIEVNSGGINFDEEIYKDPEVFDALRYYKMRGEAQTPEPEGTRASRSVSSAKAAKIAASSHFTAVGELSLAFGYGRNACPGRFFAANELKMILANALLDYEMKNSGGEVGRYPNIRLGATDFPNPEKTIMMRRVR
ncbi:Ent-kaurene oxidase-like protein [Paramyrothecium foliicola]|nr:Ent-kaurene oxidase-like protein [Paramyrothecium foliicola]